MLPVPASAGSANDETVLWASEWPPINSWRQWHILDVVTTSAQTPPEHADARSRERCASLFICLLSFHCGAPSVLQCPKTSELRAADAADVVLSRRQPRDGAAPVVPHPAHRARVAEHVAGHLQANVARIRAWSANLDPRHHHFDQQVQNASECHIGCSTCSLVRSADLEQGGVGALSAAHGAVSGVGRQREAVQVGWRGGRRRRHRQHPLRRQLALRRVVPPLQRLQQSLWGLEFRD